MLFPTLILIFLCGRMALFSILFHFQLSCLHYITFIATAICAIAFFTIRPYYKYVLSATLIAGLLNLIPFTTDNNHLTFTSGSFYITIQGSALLVCIVTAIVAMPKPKEVVIANKEQLSVNKEKKRTEDLERFKSKFGSKSAEELSEIINGQGYTAAAVDAAKQLLEEQKD